MQRRLMIAVAMLTALGLVAYSAVDDDATPSGPPMSAAAAVAETSADGVLAGGVDGFKRRLKALEGRPVVVNQWASWCPPCRAEFPFFRQAAKTFAGEVAFLGVNSGDITPAAEDFLASHPTPFPHLADGKVEIAREFGGGRSWPTTAFYDADGDVRHVTPGAYPTAEALERAIREHALDD